MRLHAAVESRAPLDAAAPPAHVAACAACRQRWNEALLLQEAFAAWTGRAPEFDLSGLEPVDIDLTDIDLADAVLSRLADSTKPQPAARTEGPVTEGPVIARRSARAQFARASAGVASLGLLAAFLLVWRLSAGGPEPNWEAARQTGGLQAGGPVDANRSAAANANAAPTSDSPPAVVAVAEVPPTTEAASEAAAESSPVQLSGLIREAGWAYLSLADEAADVVRDAASLVALRGRQPATAETDEEPPAKLFPTTPSRALAPLGRRLGEAVDFLWDSLPLGAEPST